MKSAFWRVTALLVTVGLVALGAVVPASAGLPGEVSHSAMEGSTLMRTTAQFNSWTHWIVNYDSFTELATGDYGYNNGSNPFRGLATLHWKYNDNNHLLFRVRDMDLGGQNSNFLWGGTLQNPFFTPASIVDNYSVSNYNAYDMGQMLNLAWARPLSSGGAFSLGVLYANNGQKDEPAGGTTTDDKSQAFGGQATWGNGNGFDVAASVFRESGKNNNSGNDDKSNFLNADVTARYDHNDWTYQAGVVMGTGSVKTGNPQTEDKQKLFGGIFNVGRYLYDSSDAAVTTEFYVNYIQFKEEPASGDDYKNNMFLVPGMRVACWNQISQRFQLMLGTNAYWAMSKEEQTNSGNNTTDKTTNTGMDYSWSAGLAFTPMDNLRLEGQFETANLNQILSLGNQDPLLVQLGGTYTF